MHDKQTLTVDEVAEALGISRPTVYQEINEGRLRSFKVGRGRGRRLIARKALDEFIDERERAAPRAGAA